MNMLRFVFAILLSVAPAAAQWQTPNHSVAVGQGVGITGFSFAAPGAAGIPLTSTGASSDPAFGPVSNAGLANAPANTTKCNPTGSAGAVQDCTPTQSTVNCLIFTSTLSGCVPASGGTATKTLFGDGSWRVPVGPFGASTNRGGVNQTWTPTNPNRYQLFVATTALYNQNGLFATVSQTGSAFVPPAGTTLVHLDAFIWASVNIQVTAGASPNWVAKWIKNATIDGNGFELTGTDVCTGIGSLGPFGNTVVMSAVCYDQPNPAGGDYYNLFMLIDNAGTLGTSPVGVDGNAQHSYVQFTVMAH